MPRRKRMVLRRMPRKVVRPGASAVLNADNYPKYNFFRYTSHQVSDRSARSAAGRFSGAERWPGHLMTGTSAETVLLRNLRMDEHEDCGSFANPPNYPMYFWLRVARFILARARWIVAGVVLLTLFFAYWAVQVDIDHASGHFLSEDSDVVRNFQRASESFGEGQSALYIVFSGVAYDDPEFLRQLDSFTKRASSYDGVESVLSLTNVPALQRDGDRLVPVRLYDEAAPAEANAERFRNQPFLKGLLIAESDSATVALVNVDAAFNSTPARIDLVNQIQADARAITEDAALAGFPYLRTSYTTRVKAEAPLFTILSLLISLLLLYAAYRSWRAVFMPSLVVVLGIIWTFSMLALFGHKINLVIAVLPALIVVIGTANAMHITTKYYDTYALLQKRRETLIDTIRVVGLATFLACLTTRSEEHTSELQSRGHLVCRL